MSRLARKLLMMFAVMLMGGLGLVLTSNTYADEGSFKIYAGQSTNFVYTDPFSGISTEYPGGSIEESANVIANGDGTYRVSSDRIFNSYAIELRIEGRSLVISAGSGCLGAKSAKVGFKDSIKDFRDAIQAEIGGQEWLYTCDGGFGNVTNVRVKFSVEDVTDPDKVELPAVATEEELTGGTGEVQPNCINSGGLGTLGWILCPTLDIMNGATEGVYNTFLAPALQTDPQLFTDKGAATIEGWGTFRKIANVLFIIFFLFVIFSQLTGVGIDNYGIKKILPKMILTAIMINLSYWLCIVFVDLSNILGNTFQLMFNNLFTGDASVDLTPVGGGVIGVSGALISAGILAAIMGGGWAIFNNPAIMVTLLISALGVLIAILFLFILLAVREAALVVLVVLSPLAIICYMLPNTKTLFDKWLKFFKGLLLVYPIAGLLIGGGNYVSNLLLYVGQGDSGVFSAFTAMIVGIVPIFFIPTVLRGAFSAMGNIGARISGMGQQASRAFTGAARNSEAYRNAQQAGIERRTRIHAGLDANGNPIRMGRFRRAIRGGSRGIERSRVQHRRNQIDAGRREDLLDDERYANLLEADRDNQMMQDEIARITSSGEINNIGEIVLDSNQNADGRYDVVNESGLTGSLYRALMNEDSVGIRAYTDILSGQGEAGRNAVRAAWDAAARNQVSEGAATVFGSNIMNNHSAEYKPDARSMFEVARNAQRGDISTSTDTTRITRQSLAENTRSATMVSMDDVEFDHTFGGYIDALRDPNNHPDALAEWNALSADQQHAIQYQAYQAIQNNPNMKGGRFAGVSVLAQGYTPRPGEITYISHSPNPPTPPAPPTSNP